MPSKFGTQTLFFEESQSEAMLDHLPVLVWASAPDGLRNYFNQSWLAFTGRTLEQELDGGWLDGVHPDDFDRCVGTSRTAMEAREPFQVEYRLRDSGGGYSWVLDRGLPRYDSRGAFAGYIGSCTDIDDQKAAEAALTTAEERLRLAMEAGTLGTWEWDIASGRVTWSESMETVFGLPPGTFGGTFDEFVQRLHPDDRARMVAAIEEAVQGATELHAEHRIIRPSGVVRWIEARGRPVFDASGKPAGMRGVGVDITIRKQAEEALQRSEHQRRHALEVGRTAIWEMDLITKEIVASENIEAVHGVPEGAFNGTYEGYQRFLHPDDVGTLEESISDSVHNGAPYDVEYRMVTAEGTRWVAARGEPVFDASGNAVRLRGICTDVTERKRVEEELHFLVEASDVLASSLDLESTWRSITSLAVPAIADWCAIYLLEEDHLKPVEVASVEDDPAQIALADYLKRHELPLDAKEHLAEAIRTKQPVLRHGSNRHDVLSRGAFDPELVDLLSAVPFVSTAALPLIARDQVLGVISFRTTHSDRQYAAAHDLLLAEELARRAAQAIDNARLYREAQDAARLREDLVSIASHELRSPLTSIIGFARRLARRAELAADGLSTQSREEIDIVVRESERMRSTLELFLDLARLESGHLNLERYPLELTELLSEEVISLRQRYPHATIEERYLEPSVVVVSDADRIAQIVTNLLDNAVKYGGDNPHVTLALEPDGDSALVRVRDGGNGIPLEDQPHIFERFYRRQRSSEATGRGLGLGLYISHEIAQLLGALLTFESEPGAGTTFMLQLPMKRDTAS